MPVDHAVHVTVPGAVRRPPGIVGHRAPTTAADVTIVRAVPVTTRARTVVDLADLMAFEMLRRTVDGGVRLDAAAVRDAAARAPNRRGRGAVARLLGEDGAELRTRSALERRVRGLVRDAGLPAPLVNAHILGRERDFAWPDRRLVLEVDGHAFHAVRGAREADRDRDAELVLADWRVLRLTYAQVFSDSRGASARLRRALTGRRAA